MHGNPATCLCDLGRIRSNGSPKCQIGDGHHVDIGQGLAIVVTIGLAALTVMSVESVLAARFGALKSYGVALIAGAVVALIAINLSNRFRNSTH